MMYKQCHSIYNIRTIATTNHCGLSVRRERGREGEERGGERERGERGERERGERERREGERERGERGREREERGERERGEMGERERERREGRERGERERERREGGERERLHSRAFLYHIRHCKLQKNTIKNTFQEIQLLQTPHTHTYHCTLGLYNTSFQINQKTPLDYTNKIDTI